MFFKKPKFQVCKRARIFLGTFCSSLCPFCYYRKDKKWFYAEDQILSLIQNAYKLGFTSVDFTGGEPLQYKNLDKILMYAKHLGLNTGIVTQYFDTDLLAKLRCYLDDVLLSFQTRIYNKRFSFNHVWDTLNFLYNEYPYIRINITLHNEFDLERFSELLSFISNHPQKRFQVNILPYNNWAHTDYYAERHRLFIQLWEKKLHELLTLPHVELSIRYIPFCILSENLYLVNGLFQHIYDVSDWYPDYNCITYERIYPDLESYAIQYVLINKHAYRYHLPLCYKCKLILICDGIQKHSDTFFVKPITDFESLVLDPMYFRYDKDYSITHKRL